MATLMRVNPLNPDDSFQYIAALYKASVISTNPTNIAKSLVSFISSVHGEMALNISIHTSQSELSTKDSLLYPPSRYILTRYPICSPLQLIPFSQSWIKMNRLNDLTRMYTRGFPF